MADMVIHETCSCGAVFDSAGSRFYLPSEVQKFRESHRHEFPPAPPVTNVFNEPPPAPSLPVEES